MNKNPKQKNDWPIVLAIFVVIILAIGVVLLLRNQSNSVFNCTQITYSRSRSICTNLVPQLFIYAIFASPIFIFLIIIIGSVSTGIWNFVSGKDIDDKKRVQELLDNPNID